MTDPERAPQAEEEKLRQLYRLTPAEARLAALLVRGSDLNRACEDLQVSANTARTDLKQIFQKTGTRMQGELLKRLLSDPAVFKV